MKANNCSITIEGKKGGRPFKVTTTGDVEIKPKKFPWEENDIYTFYPEPHILGVQEQYQLVADLHQMQPNGAVYRIETGKIKVKKSATVQLDESSFYQAELSTTPVAELVGVPQDTDWSTRFNQKNFSVTISWEEEA